MAGKKGQKKRLWSNEEKQSICDQTRASGVSVAQVAPSPAAPENHIEFSDFIEVVVTRLISLSWPTPARQLPQVFFQLRGWTSPCRMGGAV